MSSSSSYIPPPGAAEEGSDRAAAWAPGDSQGHPITTSYRAKSALPSQYKKVLLKGRSPITAQFALPYVSF